ncbi:MAG: hypothetical protein AAGA21_02940 [Pseudomonadota bacterium]
MNLATAENVSERPPEPAFEPDENVLTLLAEIGLSAAVRGCGEAATPIFDALALFKPNNPLAAVGRALSEISAGRPDEAIAGLRSAGVMHDNCPDELKAVLLIALCLAGHQVDASLLCRRLLNGGQGPSRQIAMRLKPVIDAGLPGRTSG